MDTIDLEVKIKFLEKSQEKLMDLYLDALVRITNLEKYIRSVNINFTPETPMEYSPPKEEKEVPEEKPKMYKRIYSDTAPVNTTSTDEETDLWKSILKEDYA